MLEGVHECVDVCECCECRKQRRETKVKLRRCTARWQAGGRAKGRMKCQQQLYSLRTQGPDQPHLAHQEPETHAEKRLRETGRGRHNCSGQLESERTEERENRSRDHRSRERVEITFVVIFVGEIQHIHQVLVTGLRFVKYLRGSGSSVHTVHTAVLFYTVFHHCRVQVCFFLITRNRKNIQPLQNRHLYD